MHDFKLEAKTPLQTLQFFGFTSSFAILSTRHHRRVRRSRIGTTATALINTPIPRGSDRIPGTTCVWRQSVPFGVEHSKSQHQSPKTIAIVKPCPHN
jgi:predicted secreted protein